MILDLLNNKELRERETELLKAGAKYAKNTADTMKEVYQSVTGKQQSHPLHGAVKTILNGLANTSAKEDMEKPKTDLNFQPEETATDKKEAPQFKEYWSVPPVRRKLQSRKFWVSLASTLASIGGAIVGMAGDNDKLAIAGMICSAVSAGLYSFINAWQKYKEGTPSGTENPQGGQE